MMSGNAVQHGTLSFRHNEFRSTELNTQQQTYSDGIPQRQRFSRAKYYQYPCIPLDIAS